MNNQIPAQTEVQSVAFSPYGTGVNAELKYLNCHEPEAINDPLRGILHEIEARSQILPT